MGLGKFQVDLDISRKLIVSILHCVQMQASETYVLPQSLGFSNKSPIPFAAGSRILTKNASLSDVPTLEMVKNNSYVAYRRKSLRATVRKKQVKS